MQRIWHNKLVKTAIFLLVVVGLLVTLALPALAAPPDGKTQGRPGILPPQKMAAADGILKAAGANITVTLNSSASINWSGPANAAVTIIYDRNTRVVQGIMWALPKMPNAPPRPLPNNVLASISGSLTASGNTIAITQSSTTPVDWSGPAQAPVSIIYDSRTMVVRNLMLKRNEPPKPSPWPNKNSAAASGTLQAAGSTITITQNASTSVIWSGPANAPVTIAYDSDTKQVLELMMMRMVPPKGLPGPSMNKKFAVTEGSLTASGSTITISQNSSSSVNWSGPASTAVTIVYDKETKVVQGIMLKRPGQPGGPPKPLPKSDLAVAAGSLTASGPTITITQNSTTSLNWTGPSTAAAAIIYENKTKVVQGIRLNPTVPPKAVPKPLPNRGMGIAAGSLTASGSTITITQNSSSSVNWSGPASAAVTIIYDKATKVVRGIMLKRPGKEGKSSDPISGVPSTPVVTPRDVTMGDVVKVERAILGLETGKADLDFNKDGRVTMGDATWIERLILGLEK
jgi:hypothetical protein